MKEKRKALMIFVILLLFLAVDAAAAETDRVKENQWEQMRWGPDHKVECAQGKGSCCLLQIVMMGEFESLDTEDMLSLRVYSASFPRMKEIEQEDLDHLALEFSEDMERIRDKWYKALANCLLADITYRQLTAGIVSDPELVLLLFLEPADAEKEAEQEEIRSRMSEDILLLLADEVQVPKAFVEWLINCPH